MRPLLPDQIIRNCKPMHNGDTPFWLKEYPQHIKKALRKLSEEGAVVYVGPEYAVVRLLDSDEIRFYTPQHGPGEWAPARQEWDGSITML